MVGEIVATALSLGCEICVCPPFSPSNVQEAAIKVELAFELRNECAHVEAIKAFDEARRMFVQVFPTALVLNTDVVHCYMFD